MKTIQITLMQIFFFTGFLVILNCGNNIPFPEERVLKRPVGVSVKANPGLTYSFTYFIANQESTFDGYELFIKREPISDGEVVSGTLAPANLTGILPTFPHGPGDFEPNTPKQVLVTTVDGTLKFEEGYTYYFRLTAHSRKGFRSDPSNEVSATALP